MRVLPAILIALGLVLAPVAWVGTQWALTNAGGTGSGVGAVDSQARIDIELMRGEVLTASEEVAKMRGQVAALQGQLDALASEVRSLPRGGATGGFDATGSPDALYDGGSNIIVDAYAQVVLIANRRKVNGDLTVPSRNYLVEVLGRPRENLTDDCQGMTNEKLRALLYTGRVGPLKVRMLKPAVDSLERVFARVRQVDQDLYDRINTAGALCVRRIRGTVSTLSSHAFGMAVDLNIDGQLDPFADGKTQMGLTILADFFHEEGWVWGAGFGREDSMHFEVSRQLFDRWRSEGLL